MNKFLIPVFALLALNSCKNKDVSLEKLQHERDSLKAIYADLEEKIKEYDERIASLDTTFKKRLVLVSSEKLQRQKFEHYFEVHGTIESDKNVTLNAEMGGLVKEIKVEEGNNVSAGQVLVVLDTDVIQKSIDELETAYELTKTLFNRQESLWKQKIGSEMQFLEAKNRMEGLDQKLKTLKAQKEMAIIRAPFDGVVDELMIKQGEMANPMFPLIRLINLAKVFINADVSESYLGKVKTGTMVHVRFPSIGEEKTYKINRIGNFINPNNRTFKIKIEVENAAQLLKPNLMSLLNIKDFESDSAVVIPSMAIQQDASGNDFIFKINRTSLPVAQKVKVKTGKSYNGKTMILEGLEGAEEIILDGARTVKDGEYIEVTK